MEKEVILKGRHLMTCSLHDGQPWVMEMEQMSTYGLKGEGKDHGKTV